MLLTEDEARWKWCPESRIVRDERTAASDAPNIVAGANRDALGRFPNPITSCRCIASDCMAWRWAYVLMPEGKGFCGNYGRPD